MNKKLKKEIYKKLCLNLELNKKELEEFRMFKLSGGNIGLIKNRCCYCNKILDENSFVIVTSYWTPMWKPCCSDSCAKIGYKKEEYACQCIDSNCNECKYFERKNFNPKSRPQTNNLIQSIGCYIGYCKKYKKEVGANRNIYQGNTCFKHRLED